MVIANQNKVRSVYLGHELLSIDNRFVRTKSLAKVPQVFTPAVWIVNPDLSFHSSQGVQLRLTASKP